MVINAAVREKPWVEIAEEVSALRALCWDKALEDGVRTSYLNDEHDSKHFHLVACLKGTVVGAVRAICTDNPKNSPDGPSIVSFLEQPYKVLGFMGRLVVHTDYAGKGCARDLLDAVIAKQFDRGAEIVIGASSTRSVKKNLLRRGFKQITPSDYLPFSDGLKMTAFGITRSTFAIAREL